LKYFLLLILFIFSCTPAEPENGNLLNSDPIECYTPTTCDQIDEWPNCLVRDPAACDTLIVSDPTECVAPYGYNCKDIAVLEKFICVNSTQVFRHYWDYNGNYKLEPLEFGYQVWDKGRLIHLDLNYPSAVIMKQCDPSELDPINYRLTQIPENIGDLEELGSLFLHDNEFSSIPSSIGNLSQLKKMDLENNLIADLPATIGNLNNLENLVLDFNQLTNLPETIGSLSSLITLEIRSNNLEILPGSVGTLSQLEWLYLNDNMLASLPDNIGALGALIRLDISHNMLSSLPNNICEIYPGQWDCEYDSEGLCISAPICTTSPKCLEFLSMGNNELCEDGIPSCVYQNIDQNIGSQNCANCDPWEFNIEGYCADSTDYNILQNFLDLNPESQALPEEAGIPEEAKECVNTDWWDDGRLIEITFDAKKLTSEIPANFGMLDHLEILNLQDNQLTGEIPSSIVNLANLKVLKLNKNNISGDIPENIGSLSNLELLRLDKNQLGCYEYDYECDPDGKDLFCCLRHCYETEQCNGEIPQNIANLQNLKKLYLNNNHFLRGSIPENIGDLSSLRMLYLHINQLSGGIPESIGNLSNLELMILQNNNLSGQIPESICNINNLTMLFHNNQLCPGEEGYPVCFPQAQIDRQVCHE